MEPDSVSPEFERIRRALLSVPTPRRSEAFVQMVLARASRPAAPAGFGWRRSNRGLALALAAAAFAVVPYVPAGEVPSAETVLLAGDSRDAALGYEESLVDALEVP